MLKTLIARRKRIQQELKSAPLNRLVKTRPNRNLVLLRELKNLNHMILELARETQFDSYADKVFFQLKHSNEARFGR